MSAPRNLVAVDLGKRVCGLAWFADGWLAGACEVRVRSGAPSTMADRLIATAPPGLSVPWFAELMLDYQSKGGRAKSLDSLRAVADALGNRGVRLSLRAAWAWKGGTPKSVTGYRVRRELDVCDVTPDEITKETIDAIGLGLFELGRVGRGVTALR